MAELQQQANVRCAVECRWPVRFRWFLVDAWTSCCWASRRRRQSPARRSASPARWSVAGQSRRRRPSPRWSIILRCLRYRPAAAVEVPGRMSPTVGETTRRRRRWSAADLDVDPVRHTSLAVACLHSVMDRQPRASSWPRFLRFAHLWRLYSCPFYLSARRPWPRPSRLRPPRP